jgi:hypothetical protein
MIKARRLQLYTQSRNSAGERVRIALHLKGLEYEYIPVSAMTSEEYRSINPQGLMPALRVGDTVFAQSTAILEYLEEKYPERPLLPTDPVEPKRVHSLSLYPPIHTPYVIIASASTLPSSSMRVMRIYLLGIAIGSAFHLPPWSKH